MSQEECLITPKVFLCVCVCVDRLQQLYLHDSESLTGSSYLSAAVTMRLDSTSPWYTQGTVSKHTLTHMCAHTHTHAHVLYLLGPVYSGGRSVNITEIKWGSMFASVWLSRLWAHCYLTGTSCLRPPAATRRDRVPPQVEVCALEWVFINGFVT